MYDCDNEEEQALGPDPLNMGQTFRWMIEEHNQGLTDWLGSDWANSSPINLCDLVRLETAELVTEMQPMKLVGLDQMPDPQRLLNIQLEAMDCLLNVLAVSIRANSSNWPGKQWSEGFDLATLWEQQWLAATVPLQSSSSPLLTQRRSMLHKARNFSMVITMDERVPEIGLQVMITQICQLVAGLDIGNDLLIKLFAAKRALNNFRVNRGYLRGAYRKQWLYSPAWWIQASSPAEGLYSDTRVAFIEVTRLDARDPSIIDKLYERFVDIYEDSP